MIHLKPAAGLCNRMRAMDSGIGLSKALHVPLKVYWVRGYDLNCPFHLLFEPIDDAMIEVVDLRVRPLRFIPTHRYFRKYLAKLGLNKRLFSVRDNDRLQNNPLESFDVDKSITIESFGRFYNHDKSYGFLTPINDLRGLIKERCASFDANTIGVHIRRTDNKKAIKNSPDELFLKQMHKALDENPDTTFYLATDSEKVKRIFTQEFGDKLMMSGNIANRNSIEGIQEALVELYTLANTGRIFGSYWSSFSMTAAHLGEIPYMYITADTV